MEQWQLDPIKADQVLNFLLSANLQNNEFRNKVIEYNKDYEFNCYVCYIFCHAPNTPEFSNCRMLAGIIIKDNVKHYWDRLPEVARQYMMNQIILTVLNHDQQIQNISANVILEIYKRVGRWPELIKFLQEAFQQSDLDVILAALKTLNRLLDDFYESFANEESQPLLALVPLLVDSLKNENEWIRYYALSSMIPLIQYAPLPFVMQFDNFLGILFGIAESPGSERILVVVCQVFCELFCGNFTVTRIMPHLENIIKFMILLTNSPNGDIALAATEFWIYLGELEPRSEIYPLLGEIVPILLNGLRLTNEEIEEMPGLEECALPDRPEEVDPSFDHSSIRPLQGAYNRTVRKNCGKALEEMSLTYKTAILDLLIPLCQAGLQSPDWRTREASLLALGASSEVVMDYRSDLILDLVNELRSLANSSEPLIRYISCWVLSRYAAWLCDRRDYFELVLQELVIHTKDKIKKVREQALCALATIFDKSGNLISPYTEVLLNELMSIYPFLRDQGLYVIHDTLGSLASAVGSALVPHVDIIMPKLLTNWNTWNDNDPRLTALMDCLSYIALALEENFLVYSRPVFLRCQNICQQVLVLMEQARKEPEKYDEPDKSFLISAFELISNIVAALKTSSADLIEKSNIVPLLIEATKDTFYQSLRAVFSLVGDLARFCPLHLHMALPQIMPLLVSNLRLGIHHSLLNNAVWAASEVVFSFADKCSPYGLELVNRAAWILENDLFHEQIRQNAALLITACALSMHDTVTRNMHEFLEKWIYTIEGLDESEQKNFAYLALFKVLKISPTPIQTGWDFFARALVSWNYEKKEDEIKQVLQTYQQNKDLWEQMISNTSYQNIVVLFGNF